METFVRIMSILQNRVIRRNQYMFKLLCVEIIPSKTSVKRSWRASTPFDNGIRHAAKLIEVQSSNISWILLVAKIFNSPIFDRTIIVNMLLHQYCVAWIKSSRKKGDRIFEKGILWRLYLKWRQSHFWGRPESRVVPDCLNLTFYPLRRESRWSKDHDKLSRSAVPPMKGSKEVRAVEKGSNELNSDE